MTRIVLVNPNTTTATTDMMTAIARENAPAGVTVEGITVASGAPLITTPDALADAARAVAALAPDLDAMAPDGVIVAAFGDPGAAQLARTLSCPVVGLAKASMARAAGIGPFAVVTTTIDLVASIVALAETYNHAERFLGVWTPPGEAARVMADPHRLAGALIDAAAEAVAGGASAVVVGGGPLSDAARRLAAECPVPVVEPVPAAMTVLADALAARCAP